MIHVLPLPTPAANGGREELTIEDGRRIVACINACAGIPTEALENGVITDLINYCEVASVHRELEGK